MSKRQGIYFVLGMGMVMMLAAIVTDHAPAYGIAAVLFVAAAALNWTA
ncbi:hypothetical protein ACQKKX_02315 [Neorhizobium sp. NPDC001467]